MKKLTLIKSALFIMAMACFLTGCEKTGVMGPQGPQGEYGPKGEAGDRGPNGAKGAKGDRGNAGPAGTKGSKGDRGDTGATGPVGAQGPEGPRGETGLQGPAGPRGAQGGAGIGNVMYSGWLPANTLTQPVVGRLEINAPRLTSAIMESGEVYVYMRLNNNLGEVYLVGNEVSIGAVKVVFDYSIATGRIWVINRDPGITIPGAGDPMKVFDYRYVLIPGGTPATHAVNPEDYGAVARVFQLEY